MRGTYPRLLRKKRHFARHPFAVMAVWVASATRKLIPNEYWRVGVFLGATSTLFAIFTVLVVTIVVAAVYVVVVVALSILALWIGFRLLGAFFNQESGGTFSRTYHAVSGSDKQHDDKEDATNPLMVAAGGKGSRAYDGTIFGGNFKGYVDNDGNIYDNSGLWGSYIGRIDSDGNVYDASGFGGNYVGRIDSDGNIYDGSGFGGNYMGCIEKGGSIYDNKGLGGSYAGRAEKD